MGLDKVRNTILQVGDKLVNHVGQIVVVTNTFLNNTMTQLAVVERVNEPSAYYVLNYPGYCGIVWRDAKWLEKLHDYDLVDFYTKPKINLTWT